MTVDEASIQKYVNGIQGISNTLGRLDTLRVHLKEKGDNFSLLVIDAVMNDLSAVLGIENKTIDIDNVKEIKEEKQISNITEKDETETHRTHINVIQDDNYIYPEELEENNIAKATLETEKAKQDLIKKKKINKVINKSAGVETDKNGNLTYKFVNSNTLDFMTYNKKTKDLIMCFLKNGRTYLYKTVPLYIFDNLYFVDEAGESAGSYFQQNIVKKWGKDKYKEITDIQLIG